MDQHLTVTAGMNIPELPIQKDQVHKTFHENTEDSQSKAKERL